MTKIFHHEQKTSDKIGVFILKRGAKRVKLIRRAHVHFKFFFTLELSEDYQYPRYVDYQILEVSGIKVEVISKKSQKKKNAILHLHGGAYVFDYSDTYRKASKKYLDFMDNLSVFSPRYSLAPEHPYPAALNECVNIYKYILKSGYKPENIIFTGDSAGGGLALAIGLYLKDHNLPLPKAMITLSPWTDLAGTGESYRENYDKDPLFGHGTEPLDIKAYTGNHDLYDPYVSPKYGNFDDFCKVLMFAGGSELILSDTLDLAAKLKDAEVHVFEGMFHVFPFGFNKMKSARTAWQLMKEFVRDKFD